MKNIINSLENARASRWGGVAFNAKTSTARLAEERGKIINHVEDFMAIGGVEQPVSNILDIFSDYLKLCGYLERLAFTYDLEESKEARGQAETIRDEYLPGYDWLNDQFFAVKELLSFVVKVGESKEAADNFERMLSMVQTGAQQAE